LKLSIVTVGRLKPGSEATLVQDYLNRFTRTARPQGITFHGLKEIEDRKGGGSAAEVRLLDAAIPPGTVRVLLDERGRMLSSIELSEKIAVWRDDAKDIAFVIGGADGFTSEFRKTANFMISFGPMVWPHMLARVMLAEQIYRSANILAGTPYHRA
jgi:23S rRNA (pseudouridine1915-N3)-methyltransferase